ncbi:Membrane-bound lytic murein transglycosylase F [Candidatus Entotheonellaceae bacterium PAL068K]
MRSLLTAGLLLVGCLSVWADIIHDPSGKGRLSLTNLPWSRHRSSPVAAPTRPLPLPVQTPPSSTRHLISELARQHNIEPRLLQAIIQVESDFNPRAVSHAGAQGLMQLMPMTAKRYHVADPFDPRANIEGGIRYLQHLFRRFHGDMRRVLAAYNAGEHAVRRYNDVPPYPETRRYVERVMALYGGTPTPRKIYRYRTTNGSILFTNIPR